MFSGKGAMKIPTMNPIKPVEINDNYQTDLGMFRPKRLLVADHKINATRITKKTCLFINLTFHTSLDLRGKDTARADNAS